MDEARDPPHVDMAAMGAFAFFVVIAGINFVGVKISNEGLAPFWGAAMRFGLAGLFLAGYALLVRLPFPRGRALVGALLFGTTGFGLSYALAYWALLGVTANLLSVLVATVPLLTILLAALHGLERVKPQSLIGGGLAAVGIAVMVARGLGVPVSTPHLIVGILVPFGFAEASVLVKKFPRAHAVTTNAIAMLVGSALLLAVSLGTSESWTLPKDMRVASAVAYLVVFGSILMFSCFLFVIQRWPVSTISYQAVLSPIVTAVVAAWLVGESVTWTFAAGGALVLLAVYIGAVRRSRPPPTPKVAEGLQSVASTSGARGP